MQPKAPLPAVEPLMVGSRSRAAARRSLWSRSGVALGPYGYLAPALVIMGVFQIIPIFYVIWLSFHHGTGLFGSSWAGLANYQRMLADPEVHASLQATLLFMLGTVPIGAALALGLALLLFESLPGLGVFRVIILLPFITPVVATTVVWQWIFNPQYGFMDSVLYGLHLPPVDWFTSPGWAMVVLVAYTLWHEVGFTVLIMLAGLSNISREVREAAHIDGANILGELRHITLPLMSPWILFVLVINVIDAFRVFTQVLTLTQGGPDHATTIVGYLIEQVAFQFFDLPYAAAISTTVLILVSILTVLQFLAGRRRVFYQ